MKQLIQLAAAISALIANATPASAGDWTGAYIGIGGGMAMANHEIDFSNGPLATPPPAFNVNLDSLRKL